MDGGDHAALSRSVPVRSENTPSIIHSHDAEEVGHLEHGMHHHVDRTNTHKEEIEDMRRLTS